MNQMKQDTSSHNCQLSDSYDLLSNFIESGIFVNFRRKIKRILLISPNHPLTRFYANSVHKLKVEEKRHLILHYYMIHPFSMFSFYFRLYMFIILSFTYFTWPVITPFLRTININKLFSLTYASYLLLIIITFCTGHYDKEINSVILNPRKVAAQYAKTYLLLDILAVCPLIVRLLIIYRILDMKDFYVRQLRRSLPLFQYGRHFYYMDTFKQIRLYIGMNHYVYLAFKSLINFMIFMLLLNFSLYSMLKEVPYFSNVEPLDNALSTLAITMMVSHGQHISDHILDKMCPILLIILGFVIQLMIFVNVLELWFKFYSTEKKQVHVYSAIGAYMQYKALPVTERERIYLFLNFKYQHHFYKESNIKQITSEFLRREIIIRISKTSTDKVELFKNIPEYIMRKLRGHLVSQIYLPNDVIIKAGATGKCMFFILAGTVAVTTPEGTEICRLRDGTHFGEIALVINVARVATVVALTPCELYKLNRKHFLEVVENYPALLKELTDMVAERIAKTESLSIIQN